MSQMRWNPFREIEELLDRYTRGVGSGLGNLTSLGSLGSLPASAGAREALARPDWIPAVDIIERKDCYQIKVELPEVRKEDVSVSVDKGVLTIAGERRLELEEGGDASQQRRLERVYGSFSRSFTLPDEADENGIDASYQDGMLVLTVPRLEKPASRAIEVKVH